MTRFMTITLDKHGVSCKARLLDDAAPRTCQALWDALPLSAPVFHGKYARNEIYTLLPAFTEHDPGKENTTVTPTCAGSHSKATISPTRRTGTKPRMNTVR